MASVLVRFNAANPFLSFCCFVLEKKFEGLRKSVMKIMSGLSSSFNATDIFSFFMAWLWRST